MARRRRPRRRQIYLPRRLVPARYLVKTPVARYPYRIANPRVRPLLSTDRRSYHPARDARPIYDKYANLSVSLMASPGKSYRTAFVNPALVSVCLRRAQRRKAIFASGAGGSKGLGLNKRRRTNEHSLIKC